jgi:hypothetical protein
MQNYRTATGAAVALAVTLFACGTDQGDGEANCLVVCGERECGDDGCGGECGRCPMAAPICGEDGYCMVAPATCESEGSGTTVGHLIGDFDLYSCVDLEAPTSLHELACGQAKAVVLAISADWSRGAPAIINAFVAAHVDDIASGDLVFAVLYEGSGVDVTPTAANCGGGEVPMEYLYVQPGFVELVERISFGGGGISLPSFVLLDGEDLRILLLEGTSEDVDGLLGGLL